MDAGTGKVIRSARSGERYGFKAARIQFRQIEGKLWQIKASTHRVLYVVIDRDEMVLLHAYKKQGQKLPIKERDIAIQRMKELLL
ncbi:MAG: type II toxin-antitoxin system RelE/ParE family toxin [Candidatus Binatia bacterium]